MMSSFLVPGFFQWNLHRILNLQAKYLIISHHICMYTYTHTYIYTSPSLPPSLSLSEYLGNAHCSTKQPMDIASHRHRFDVFPQGTRGCGDRFLDGWLGGCLRHRLRGRLQTHRWPRAGAAARLPRVSKDPGGAEQQEIRHSGDDGYDDQTERLCQHPRCRMLGDGWGWWERIWQVQLLAQMWAWSEWWSHIWGALQTLQEKWRITHLLITVQSFAHVYYASHPYDVAASSTLPPCHVEYTAMKSKSCCERGRLG